MGKINSIEMAVAKTAARMSDTNVAVVSVENVNVNDIILSDGLGSTLQEGDYTIDATSLVSFTGENGTTIVPVFSVEEKPGRLTYMSSFTKIYFRKDMDPKMGKLQSSGDFSESLKEMMTGSTIIKIDGKSSEKLDWKKFLAGLVGAKFRITAMTKYSVKDQEFDKPIYKAEWISCPLCR